MFTSLSFEINIPKPYRPLLRHIFPSDYYIAKRNQKTVNLPDEVIKL